MNFSASAICTNSAALQICLRNDLFTCGVVGLNFGEHDHAWHGAILIERLEVVVRDIRRRSSNDMYASKG